MCIQLPRTTRLQAVLADVLAMDCACTLADGPDNGSFHEDILLLAGTKFDKPQHLADALCSILKKEERKESDRWCARYITLTHLVRNLSLPTAHEGAVLNRMVDLSFAPMEVCAS